MIWKAVRLVPPALTAVLPPCSVAVMKYLLLTVSTAMLAFCGAGGRSKAAAVATDGRLLNICSSVVSPM